MAALLLPVASAQTLWCVQNLAPANRTAFMTRYVNSQYACAHVARNHKRNTAFTYMFNGTCTVYPMDALFQTMAFDDRVWASCNLNTNETAIAAWGYRTAAGLGYADPAMMCVPNYYTQGENLMPVPPEPPLSTDTLAECARACTGRADCDHVVYSAQYRDFGVSACWLKRHFEGGNKGQTTPGERTTAAWFRKLDDLLLLGHLGSREFVELGYAGTADPEDVAYLFPAGAESSRAAAWPAAKGGAYAVGAAVGSSILLSISMVI